MDPLEDEELVAERLTRVVAGELEVQIAVHRSVRDIPMLIADEIMRGFQVRLREPRSGSYGEDPVLPDKPIRLD
jgi:hypothetical protein